MPLIGGISIRFSQVVPALQPGQPVARLTSLQPFDQPPTAKVSQISIQIDNLNRIKLVLCRTGLFPSAISFLWLFSFRLKNFRSTVKEVLRLGDTILRLKILGKF